MGRLLLVCAALAGCAPAPPADAFRAAATSPHVVFVQLGGETLQAAASDDATTDHSALGTVAVPPFDASKVAPDVAASDAAGVLFDRLRTVFAPWNVTLTRTRPASGAYTLVAVGGDHTLVGANDGVAGIASGVDCSDANAANVVYDFSDEQTPGFGGVVAVAATAAHEVGHAFGLEHTDDTKDVMYTAAMTMQMLPDVFALSFRETGAYASFGAGGLSGPEQCGRGNPVNAGVLAANVGASTRTDTTAPTVSYANGIVQATDDTGVVRIEVYVNFALEQVLTPPQDLVTAQMPMTGDYYLTIEAIDAAANRGRWSQLLTAPPSGNDVGTPDDLAAAPDAGADAGTLVASGGCSFAPASAPTFTFALALTFALTAASRAARSRRARRAKRC